MSFPTLQLPPEKLRSYPSRSVHIQKKNLNPFISVIMDRLGTLH